MSPVEFEELEAEDDLGPQWDDLYGRLKRAADGLALLADQRDDPFDHERLLGKVNGVQLAMSFMREYRPAP